ncbi:cobalt ECF transporter T component CbiQ [Propionibacterium freudenreichii]|uniref:Cobalt transport protein CbiQ n=4 Tax=Propionibacterium freudenreichii TaxID=1744 RepID=D7GIR9_PROFC|nr:cobalt ECF transporter T component CbiQ [Propionibacterium freudenreichii]PWM98128.1 MAG: cobalt ECF transporter T component CbiQ [Propionibacterium sp.]AJQ90155.1 Cobalt ABC transporter, permease protein CbiQ [Propionibacterium freudenreichii subsp. freudenreichii]ARO12622.1 cobalt ECF transporter T component CbiQ [Propionibacterium freudenreichii]MCQ1997927.1 cobalt ECF transporter T component CbiQ [Propionibacterium freudenreichii]MCT2973417.1 cobalt ECF transporter T component CbiQ [Pro
MSGLHIGALDDAAWGSPWRRRRVGEKVACSMGLVLTALLAPTWPGTLLVAVAAIALIVGAARIRPRVLLAAMSAPIVFLILGAISVLFSVGTAPADAWWHAAFLSVGPTSVAQAARLFAHGLSGTLAVMVLATTTPMVDLLTWLRRFRVPDPLLEIASLTYRLLFVLAETTANVLAAQRCRLGDNPVGRWNGLSRRWHNTAAAVGAIGLRAWDRSSRLTEGLAHRGFETSLVTLPVPRVASPRLITATVVVLAAIWSISLVVAR